MGFLLAGLLPFLSDLIVFSLQPNSLSLRVSRSSSPSQRLMATVATALPMKFVTARPTLMK